MSFPAHRDQSTFSPIWILQKSSQTMLFLNLQRFVSVFYFKLLLWNGTKAEKYQNLAQLRSKNLFYQKIIIPHLNDLNLNKFFI